MFTKLNLDDFRIFKNQTIHIGNTITAIAGQNATGKSTILGILGNACELKTKFGTTITDKQFKTEFLQSPWIDDKRSFQYPHCVYRKFSIL